MLNRILYALKLKKRPDMDRTQDHEVVPCSEPVDKLGR